MHNKKDIDKNINTIISILKKEITKYKKPIVTVVSEAHKDPYLVLISCILSLRTKDEVTTQASSRLFKIADTPQKLVRLSTEKIEKLIYPVGFYITKAKRIQEIADTLKLLKSVLNPFYEKELTGTSLKNIDPAILGRFRLLKDSLPLPEFLEAVLMDSGLKAHYGEEKFGFIANLASSYQGMKPASALACFVNELNLLSPGDEFDTNADAVSLMTLHMAKGLEFRVVFITGVEEGIIPYIKNEQCDMEEERRLFYVGMTRASNELFLIHARKRFLYGQTRFPAPSPFLADIPETLRQHTTIHDRQKKQKTEKQIGLF